MKTAWIVVAAVLGLFVLVAIIVGGTFVSKWNQLVTMDTDIKAKWAQVDNQLQRRNDLIPNLVETVKGFATQEKSIMESIANARAKMAGAGVSRIGSPPATSYPVRSLGCSSWSRITRS